MSIDLQDRVEYTLCIDTDQYAGNFEREMFEFIFGVATKSPYYHSQSDTLKHWGKTSDVLIDTLLEQRVIDPGDDGIHRGYVTIAPTPGFFNDGNGGAFEDTPTNRRRYKKRYPSYQSVAVFLQRLPAQVERSVIEQRAHDFSKMPKKNVWNVSPKIIGFRLVKETVSVTLMEW